MRETDPHKAVDYLLQHSTLFSEAKATRIYLEEFRKSKKALLMNESSEDTAVAREQFAYSHPEYVELLKDLRKAISTEEKLRWDMVAAQARIEIWKQEQYNNRAIDKAVT
jgi:hypothetical protein